MIGFLSYDYARRIENLPSVSHDDLEVPDLYFYYLDRWAVFDHQENTAWTMILSDEGTQTAEQQLKEWTGLWTDALINSEGETDRDIIRQTPAEIEKSMDEAAFSEAVEKIQAYISQGDVFQVNLSVRQSQQLQAEPYTVYKNCGS